MRLSLNRVSAGYHDRMIVKEADFTVQPNEFVGVLGRNGCGKSTLLKVMTGLLQPRQGGVTLGDDCILRLPRSVIAKRVASLPQHPSAPSQATVRELVGYGRVPHVRWYQRWSSDDQTAVEEAIERCNLENLADRTIGSLSGGERQRAWIAMTLTQQSPLLLLDEPLSFLDINHQLEVMELLCEIQRWRPIAIIIVMHDINLAGRYCNRILAMHNGHILHDGSPEHVLTDANLEGIFHVHARVDRDCVSGSLICNFYSQR